MLIILPLLAFLLVFIDLLGLHSRRGEELGGVRLALLESAAFLGGYMVVFSEILSLFHLLAGPWVALCWGLAIVAAGWLGWQKRRAAAGWRYLCTLRPRLDWFDWTAGAILAVILLLLFLSAIISPANNNDSLQYHMSRVVHWAQDRSLSHYATAYEVQLESPVGAELAILNLRLLWGDDRLANLVQWGSLVLTLVGVSALAKLLGAGRKGQWATAAFGASLPMAILQATSTQNDLVTAFWVICLLYFAVLSARRNLFPEELLGLAFAFGLGMATKGTFYPFAVPPMLYFIVLQFARHKVFPVILRGALIAAIAATLNLGFWGRNVATFGGPLGPVNWVGAKVSGSFSPGPLAGSLVRDLVRNLVTPNSRINSLIVDRIQAAFRSIDPAMKTLTLEWGWNHEDLAGNPLHLLLVPVTLLLLLIYRQRINARLIWPFLAVAIGLFILLAVVVNSGNLDTRYQMPFFAAWAALFGVAVEVAGRKCLPTVSVLILLIAAFPWVMFNRTRPLIAMRPSHDPFTIPCLAGCTAGSILNEPPVRVLFAGWIDLQGPYTQATSAIRESACRSVGLQLDSHDIEYTFWWLLDAPQSGMRLETIYTYPELERYLDPSFKPCAILCTICRGKPRLHGLDLVSDYTGKVQLYMGPHYDPDPNK